MLNLLTILPSPGLSGTGAAPNGSTGFAEVLSRLLAGAQAPTLPAGVAAPRHAGVGGVPSPSLSADLPHAVRSADRETSDLALLVPGATPLLVPDAPPLLVPGAPPPPVSDAPPLLVPGAPALQSVLDPAAGPVRGQPLAGAPGSPTDGAEPIERPAGQPATPSAPEPVLADPGMPEGASSPEPVLPSDRSAMPFQQGVELAPGAAAEPPGQVRPMSGRERATEPLAEALPADRQIEPAQAGATRSTPAETTIGNPLRAAASRAPAEAVQNLPSAGVEPVATEVGFDPISDLAEGLRVAERTSSVNEPSSAAPRATANPAASQVEVHLTRAAQGRVDRLVVQLEPMDLGKVEIRLEFGDEGRVGAVISAERPETLEALQRDSHALERSLREAGLRPDGGGLSFDLKRQPSDGQGNGDRAHPERLEDATTVDADPPPERRLPPLRLLDIQA